MTAPIDHKLLMQGKGYSATAFQQWLAVPASWRSLADEPHASPFQGGAFLQAWYDSFCDGVRRKALIVTVSDEAGQPVMLLPLCVSQEGGLKVISFADAGVSDNNAPLPGPAVPRNAVAMRLAWDAVRQVLPPHDVLRIEKMPASVNGRPNPLTLLRGVVRGPLSAHPLDLGELWSVYVRSRAKKFRKEQGRVWRVFQRLEGARFDMIVDADEALALLPEFERLQSERMRALGETYILDGEPYRAFYRGLLKGGLQSGAVAFGALRAEGQLIGGLIAIRNRHALTLVRLSHGGEAWSFCSPGRLVIERLLEWAHEAGYHKVDFSIGDYAYKQDFGVGSEALMEYVAPGSLKGLPAAGMHALKALARRSERLRRIAAALRGRSVTGPAPWVDKPVERASI